MVRSSIITLTICSPGNHIIRLIINILYAVLNHIFIGNVPCISEFLNGKFDLNVKLSLKEIRTYIYNVMDNGFNFLLRV